MTAMASVKVDSGLQRRARSVDGPSLANYWHPMALVSDVDEQPRRFTLLGEDVVAFRHAGGISAMRDLCIHRGTRLSLGTVVDDRIVCPYHGWEYDCTGACVHIPSLPPGSSIPTKARTDVYRTEEMYGLVWVALADPVAPIPFWPEDDAWGENSAFTVFMRDSSTWNANAGRIVENASDFSHFNFLHRGLLELANGPQIKPYKIESTEYGLRFSYNDSRITREYSIFAPFTFQDRKEMNGEITILTGFCKPIDSTTTHIYRFMARNHKKDTGFRQEMTEAELIQSPEAKMVLAQDRMIVESQRPEIIPLDLREELHLKVPDASGIAYRKLLASIAGSEPFMP